MKSHLILMIRQDYVISPETATQKILHSFGPSSIFNIKARTETSARMKYEYVMENYEINCELYSLRSKSTLQEYTYFWTFTVMEDGGEGGRPQIHNFVLQLLSFFAVQILGKRGSARPKLLLQFFA